MAEKDQLFDLETPLGVMRVKSDDERLYSIKLMDPKEQPGVEFEAKSELHKEAEKQLKSYFEGELQSFDLPLALQILKPFARKVTEALLQVSFGHTLSYKDLAVQAGSPNAARAVGAVLAANPWVIVVPCHRVLSSTRRLHGYSAPGGVDTKAWLLRHEGIDIETAKKLEG